MGNLNVNGITTIIDTVINNTSINSLSVSGPSIYYCNVTLISSLNVSGSTTLNNDTTLISNLNVSGNSNFNNLNVSGATYCYGHLFVQQNVYVQNSIPSYDPLVPNRALNLNSRGTGNLIF
jgi:hypothetical protein